MTKNIFRYEILYFHEFILADNKCLQTILYLPVPRQDSAFLSRKIQNQNCIGNTALRSILTSSLGCFVMIEGSTQELTKVGEMHEIFPASRSQIKTLRYLNNIDHWLICGSLTLCLLMLIVLTFKVKNSEK